MKRFLKYSITLLVVMILVPMTTNAQTIKRQKQKTEQTTKPKAKQEQKKQKSKASSNQSNSIKSKKNNKSDSHNTELVKAIDEIVASINSIKSIEDSKSKNIIDKAIRIFNGKIKNDQFIKQKYNNDVEHISKLIHWIGNVIRNAQYNKEYEKEIREHKMKYKDLPKTIDKQSNELIIALEDLKSKISNVETNTKPKEDMKTYPLGIDL